MINIRNVNNACTKYCLQCILFQLLGWKNPLTALEHFWCFPIVTQIYWCLFIVAQNVTKEQARNIKRMHQNQRQFRPWYYYNYKESSLAKKPPKKSMVIPTKCYTMCSAIYKMCYCITFNFTIYNHCFSSTIV